MAIRNYITRSAAETQKLGESLGKKLSPPAIIAFESDLGGGKTTLIQGLAKGLGIKGKVISPTFVLEKIYVVPKKKFSLYHYDVYRLAPDPLLIGEILENAEDNIVAIEWADRIKEHLPKNTVWVKISLGKNDDRQIKIVSASRHPRACVSPL
ncbi:MAG: tRNA (adenosine(37)-N6)-threonylcarbamoyltransferase complex ATPase subunit type 1 TsaE [Patescibacteria group bacterium]